MESTPSSPDKVTLEILQLDEFRVPLAMSDKEREDSSRRFLTLFRSPNASSHQGGSGIVSKVTNTAGETFALKEMLPENRRSTDSDEDYNRMIEGQRVAFHKEWESQQRLASLKGFPKLYGYGTLHGNPVILMEWIEGMTLGQARSLLAINSEGQVAPLTIAKIAQSVFELLSRMEYLESDFIHRDLSPGNIMFKTDKKDICEQCESGEFDICLIDFGSARAATPQNASFTVDTKIIRKATPEYAAPEMLSEDLPNVNELRKSPSIDVYAVCSILYELMSGHTPYQLNQSPFITSYYRYKIENEIAQPQGAHVLPGNFKIDPDKEANLNKIVNQTRQDEGNDYDEARLMAAISTVDRQLSAIIMNGLKTRQEERPSAQQMKVMLSTFRKNYFMNLERKYHGEKLLPFLTPQDGPSRTTHRPKIAPLPQQTTILAPQHPNQVIPGYAAQLPSTLQSTPKLGKAPIVAVSTFCLAAIVFIIAYAGTVIGDAPFFILSGSIIEEGSVSPRLSMLLLATPPAVSLVFFWAPSKPSSKLLGGISSLCLCDALLVSISLVPIWQTTMQRCVFGLALIVVAAVIFIGSSVLYFAKRSLEQR